MLGILGKNFWSLKITTSIEFVRLDRWGSLYLSVLCKRRSGGMCFFLKSNQNQLIPQLQTSHLGHACIYIYMYCIRTYLHLSLYIYICEIIHDTNRQKMIKEISVLCCGLPSNLTNCNWVFPMKGACIWRTKLVQSLVSNGIAMVVNLTDWKGLFAARFDELNISNTSRPPVSLKRLLRIILGRNSCQMGQALA